MQHRFSVLTNAGNEDLTNKGCWSSGSGDRENTRGSCRWASFATRHSSNSTRTRFTSGTMQRTGRGGGGGRGRGGWRSGSSSGTTGSNINTAGRSVVQQTVGMVSNSVFSKICQVNCCLLCSSVLSLSFCAISTLPLLCSPHHMCYNMHGKGIHPASATGLHVLCLQIFSS